MGRSPCDDTAELKRGPWTPEEDQKLKAYIQQHGHGSWCSLPQKAGIQRCGKSCRLRWINYLRPDIKRGKFSLHEEQTIIQLHALLGNRWSAIAAHLPNRTDNEIKNHWNTHLKKRLAKMGIDPVTHKSKMTTFRSIHGDPKKALNLSHMAQWESARLEAEARLVRESKLRKNELALLSESTQVLNKRATRLAPPRCWDILKAWQNVCLTKSTEISSSSSLGCPGFGISFCGGCDLESLNSILKFSEIANVGKYNGNVNEVFAETSRQGNVGFHGGDSWITEPSSNGDQTLIQGVNNMIFNNPDRESLPTINIDETNGDDSNGRMHEGNKRYWNDILNLVDCEPSITPIF